MKDAYFSDVTSCDSSKNRCLDGTERIHHQETRMDELGTSLAVIINRRTLRRILYGERTSVFRKQQACSTNWGDEFT
jgi:hypothetical protein